MLLDLVRENNVDFFGIMEIVKQDFFPWNDEGLVGINLCAGTGYLLLANLGVF